MLPNIKKYLTPLIFVLLIALGIGSYFHLRNNSNKMNHQHNDSRVSLLDRIDIDINYTDVILFFADSFTSPEI